MYFIIYKDQCLSIDDVLLRQTCEQMFQITFERIKKKIYILNLGS